MLRPIFLIENWLWKSDFGNFWPNMIKLGKFKIQLAVLKYVLNVWLCYQSKHIILVKKTDAQGPAVTCLYQYIYIFLYFEIFTNILLLKGVKNNKAIQF